MAVDPFVSDLVGYDCTFELDDFSNPKLCSESETIKNALLFVLFSKPGQYPSIPYLGMDVRNMLYSYYDEINEADLEDQLTAQCRALGPYFKQGDIAIKKMIYRGMPSLLIHISTEVFADGENPMGGPTKPQNREYYIGLSLNELQELIYNINSKPAGSVR